MGKKKKKTKQIETTFGGAINGEKQLTHKNKV